jgi:CheY-like chemotaxis protein
MLVEDDNNLREIYQARLSSEGYDTVTASDGEEALSIVGREKPDLIILDVMMPKISGFDTLDLLKNNPLTRDIKVIMMTALSQAEDRARAQKLGAQNYLVKSQVTLEDIVKAIKDALSGTDIYPGDATETTETVTPVTPEAPTPSVFNMTAPTEENSSTPTETPAISTDPALTPTADPINSTPIVDPVSDPTPDTSTVATPDSASSMFSTPSDSIPMDTTTASADPITSPTPDMPATDSNTVPTPVVSEPTSMFDPSASTVPFDSPAPSEPILQPPADLVSSLPVEDPTVTDTSAAIPGQPSNMFIPTTPETPSIDLSAPSGSFDSTPTDPMATSTPPEPATMSETPLAATDETTSAHPQI